jgi:hypothetical protein
MNGALVSVIVGPSEKGTQFFFKCGVEKGLKKELRPLLALLAPFSSNYQTHRRLLSMFKRIVRHMKDVAHAISEMPASGAFAFALACTERQWPVFQRAVGMVPSMVDWRGVLRQRLDVAWEDVKKDEVLPGDESLAPFRELLLSWGAGEAQVEDSGGSSSVAACEIAGSVVDLLDAIQERDASYARYPSNRNFDLLELLLDERSFRLDDLKEESGHDPSEIAGVRELIEQEMQQQNQDVQALSKNSSAAGIEEVRQAKRGRSSFSNVEWKRF